MRIADFELERYFARWEFAVKHLLCASDVQGWSMSELLDHADEETAALWRDLHLGYTEAPGHPLLRREIASLYETATPDDIQVLSGAEEGIFALVNVLLEPGDHAIVTWPGYQSLYEIARACGAAVTLHELREDAGWAIDVETMRGQVTPRTKLIVINAPHNPTGMLPDRATFEAVVAIAAEAGAHLLVDEVYRYLEFEDDARLPAGVDAGPHVVSLGVMSKSFAMAGLRIGWLASRDHDLLAKVSSFKDYTTICASAPSEILSLIALRARAVVLGRSQALVARNMATLDALFARWPDTLSWVRPAGGSIGFPRLRADLDVDAFSAALVEQEGVLLLPGSRFGHPGNHFRIGFGRDDLDEAVAGLERHLERVAREPALPVPARHRSSLPARVRPHRRASVPTDARPTRPLLARRTPPDTWADSRRQFRTSGAFLARWSCSIDSRPRLPGRPRGPRPGPAIPRCSSGRKPARRRPLSPAPGDPNRPDSSHRVK